MDWEYPPEKDSRSIFLILLKTGRTAVRFNFMIEVIENIRYNERAGF
jgi:hypothetical protein